MNQRSFKLERSDPLLSNEELISNAIKGLPAKIQQFFNFLMMCVDCYVMTLSLNIEVRRGCLKLQHPFYSNSRISLVFYPLITITNCFFRFVKKQVVSPHHWRILFRRSNFDNLNLYTSVSLYFCGNYILWASNLWGTNLQTCLQFHNVRPGR